MSGICCREHGLDWQEMSTAWKTSGGCLGAFLISEYNLAICWAPPSSASRRHHSLAQFLVSQGH